MTLNLKMVLELESKAAKAEIDALAGSVKKLGDEAAIGGAKSKAGAAGTGQLGDAARRSAANLNTLIVAERGAALGAAEVGRASAGAAGSVGGLGSVFARLGPMIGSAAGTAAGAIFSIINPVNLLTGAAIGAASAMVQWLFSAGEEAKSFRDDLQLAAQATVDIQTEIDKLRFGVDEKYQVDLLREQIQLRGEYNAKVAELQGYLANTTDSIDRQRISTVGLRAEIEAIAIQYNNISATLSDQQNKSTQLAILKGIEAQRAGEVAARVLEGERAAAQLLEKAQGVGAAIASAASGDLSGPFARAFPTANALLGLANSIATTLGVASAQAAALDSAKNTGLAAQYAQYGAGRVAGEQLIKGAGPLYGGTGRIKIGNPAPSGGGSSGGGAAARDEASALEELIRSLEGEIDALRVQDPIQQEMLKHREALTGATEAERQKVEALIVAREREKAAMQAITEVQNFLESTVDGAFEALIVKGESLQDVLKGVIAALAKAAIQAALFGSGPMGGLFGGKGIGDIFMGLFSGGKAEGGMIYGPGTATSDSILTPLSVGEYVVNAKATARHRHMLEAINAGATGPGMAMGGAVGSDRRRDGARGDGGSPTFNINLAGARGDREIEAAAHAGMKRALQEYDRDSLPGSVKRVSGDPRRTG